MLQQFLKFIKLTPKLTAILGAMFVLLAQINGTPLFERDTHAKPENAVRIMSFNILSERFGENSVINRKEAVAKTIAEYYPDSFGAQECTTLWMAYLKQQLPEYGSVGELSTEVPFLGGYSPVFYLKNKYDVVDSGTFWLSEIPDVSSLGWDAGSIRVCTWVILQTNSPASNTPTSTRISTTKARWPGKRASRWSWQKLPSSISPSSARGTSIFAKTRQITKR